MISRKQKIQKIMDLKNGKIGREEFADLDQQPFVFFPAEGGDFLCSNGKRYSGAETAKMMDRNASNTIWEEIKTYEDERRA